MTVSTVTDTLKQTTYLKIRGNFDFSINKVFRDAYRDIDSCKYLVVDLSEVDYMDSAALGMLLLLREESLEHGFTVSLEKPNPIVARVLEIANFARLFDIKLKY